MTMKRMMVKTLDILKVLLLPAVVYVLFFALSGGKFGSGKTMLMILQQSLVPALVSLAMCPNMICGRMDLSAGSIVMLSAMVGARLVNTFTIGIPAYAAVCVGLGLVLGIVSGAMYLAMRVPAIVTALGLCMIFEMFSNLCSMSWCTSITGVCTIPGRMPWNFIIFAFLFIAFYIIFNHTPFGYHVRAAGGNQLIARNSGINVKRNAFFCYVISGVYLGAAALLKLSTQGSIDTAMYMSSTNIIFNCMLSIYIGFAIEKYCNIVVGITIGNIIMNMMASGLLSIGLPASLQDVASGAVLLCIMLYTYNNQRVIDHFSRIRLRNSLIHGV